MSELNLPELPKNYRWKVEAESLISGRLCYWITLDRKRWFGWEILENGFSDDLTQESVTELALKLWDRHQSWLAAKQNEGEFYGNDSN
jgi:hypothetical protein